MASVSCIYTLGDPIDYRNMVISLRPGMTKDRDELISKLVELQYERNDINFVRNKFRVRGDVVEIFPAYSSETAIRVEFFGDEVDRITRDQHRHRRGEKLIVSHVAIYPASHYIVPREQDAWRRSRRSEREMRRAGGVFPGATTSSSRRSALTERTNYDIEMLQEIGFCKGIENYSRVLSGRASRAARPTRCWITSPRISCMFIDESHVTLPQVRGMYGGDRARKEAPGRLWVPAALGAGQPPAEF